MRFHANAMRPEAKEEKQKICFSLFGQVCLAHLGKFMLFDGMGFGGGKIQVDFNPSCTLPAHVSYEMGGRVGVSGSHWQTRKRT